MLPRRELGRTGLRVSPLGLGTVKFGRAVGVKYPTRFEIPDDEAAASLLAFAAERGVNLLDTAPAYGESESRLGRVLGSNRDQWVICTKAGEEFDQSRGVSSFDFSESAITASAERSLRRLRTDRVECLLLHSDGSDAWILRDSGAMDALASLRRRGLICSAGISTKTLEGALLAVERCDVVMLTLNVQEQADLPAIEAARAAGVGVLVKKALASGHVGPGAVEESLTLALTTAGVSSVIVGTINQDHLKHNIETAARCLA